MVVIIQKKKDNRLDKEMANTENGFIKLTFHRECYLSHGRLFSLPFFFYNSLVSFHFVFYNLIQFSFLFLLFMYLYRKFYRIL